MCSDLQVHDRVRGQDIQLLRFFNVEFIFDLMLEMKKVKFGMKYVLKSRPCGRLRVYVGFDSKNTARNVV